MGYLSDLWSMMFGFLEPGDGFVVEAIKVIERERLGRRELGAG